MTRYAQGRERDTSLGAVLYVRLDPVRGLTIDPDPSLSHTLASNGVECDVCWRAWAKCGEGSQVQVHQAGVGSVESVNDGEMDGSLSSLSAAHQPVAFLG